MNLPFRSFEVFGQPAQTIITVQHNAKNPILFDPYLGRRQGRNWGQDLRTLELAKRIHSETGPLSCIVWNTVPRMFLETNTDPGEEAFREPLAEKCFHAFHNCVSKVVSGSAGRYGRRKVLLLDLHVFSEQPPYAPPLGYDIILGTSNRRTVHTDIDVYITEKLERRGLIVFLPREIPRTSRPDRYNGGYLVRHHGMTQFGLAGAIQIEISSSLSQSPRSMGRESADKRETLTNELITIVNEFGQ